MKDKNTEKSCFFSVNSVKEIDYKDTEVLKKFLNPHARMIAGKYTSVCAKHQRQLATAVKRARFMALIPFVSR